MNEKRLLQFFIKLAVALTAIVLLIFVSIALTPKEAKAIIGGAIGVHTHASNASGGGTLNLSGTLASTKACASGFTRVSPNFCLRDNTGSVAVFSQSATGCVLSTALSASDVKAVLLRITQDVVSTNLVSLKVASVRIYAVGDTTCAGANYVELDANIHEAVAVAAGTPLLRRESHHIVRTSSTGVFPVQWVSGGTVAGTVDGYFD